MEINNEIADLCKVLGDEAKQRRLYHTIPWSVLKEPVIPTSVVYKDHDGKWKSEEEDKGGEYDQEIPSYATIVPQD